MKNPTRKYESAIGVGIIVAPDVCSNTREGKWVVIGFDKNGAWTFAKVCSDRRAAVKKRASLFRHHRNLKRLSEKKGLI